jgi:8-oxo-dGTP diphosphatase
MSYVPTDAEIARARRELAEDNRVTQEMIPWGVAVIFARQRDGQLEVLAVECSSKGAPDRWSLPGGSPERGETLEQAARRESAEETGLHPGELVSVGVVRSGTEERPCFTAVFVARNVEYAEPDAPRGSFEGAVDWRPFRQLAAGPYSQAIHAIALQIGYRL